jgi:hypothetical protein
MNTKTLVPALLIVHLVIAACMVNGSERETNRSGGSMPSARDVESSFDFDCMAWQANARFSGRAAEPAGAWSAVGTDPSSCMDLR